VFERFDEQARQVVVNAQEGARELHHNYIGTEHILLGLVAEADDLPARVLSEFGVEREGVWARIVEQVGIGNEPVTTGQIPFTPRAKKILELSLREALGLGHNGIGSGHVLLGLLREGEGVGSEILRDCGVASDPLRERVLAALAEAPAPHIPARGRAAPGGAPRVGPGSSASISFSVQPDRKLQRLLMAAGGRALGDARWEFSLADLVSVIRALPDGERLLSGDGDGDLGD